MYRPHGAPLTNTLESTWCINKASRAGDVLRQLLLIFLFSVIACGDGVIQQIPSPPKDRGILEVDCQTERLLFDYRGSVLAGCRHGQKRTVILREGIYHLRFYAPGHYAQYRVVSVDAGKLTSIRIELLKAPD